MPPEAVNDTLNSKLASDCKPLTFAGDVWSFAMTALEVCQLEIVFRIDLILMFIYVLSLS